MADDNEKAVKLVGAALESAGHKGLCAYGGAEAIETARGAAPDMMGRLLNHNVKAILMKSSFF